MTSQHRTHSIVMALAALAVTAVTGCASTTTEPGDAPQEPTSPTAVVGQGTVLQIEGEDPQFCLGAVMESYPPQCSGPELIGWDWNAVEGEESASGVTWGTYAVWGDWDGTRLAVTDTIMLALYDPMPVEDPYVDPRNAGSTSEADLLSIQEVVHEEAPVEVLTSTPQNGYLFVTVVFDGGAVQEWADLTYGPDVVLIRPALRPVE
ncbi:MAG: hypothetical protein JWP85_1729 [Rhodoglobus sp.]|nr:hypothetical protein [Rhodoglobus sp.]